MKGRLATLGVVAFCLTNLDGCTLLRSRAGAIENLQTVSIDPVVVPDRAHYDGPETEIASAGGVGQVVAGVLSETKADRITGYLRQHRIDPSAILQSAFTRELRRDPHFSTKVTEGAADAHFLLMVQEYGLYEVIPFSARLVPRYRVQAQLIAADGAILWQHHGRQNYSEQLAANSLDDLLGDPRLLSDEFREAASEASDSLLFKLDRFLGEHS